MSMSDLFENPITEQERKRRDQLRWKYIKEKLPVAATHMLEMKKIGITIDEVLVSREVKPACIRGTWEENTNVWICE